jgi:predicted 3-demethylubiquinone-9 3-methyltransferase (glyoxalase superfamily)
MITQKITTFLWFDTQAEEAADFYCSIFPNSRVLNVTPDPRTGRALVVGFELAGVQFLAMNGGPGHPFTEAISLSIDCRDQAEVDHYWGKLTDGGEGIACSWLKDRYGLRWQVVPAILPKLLGDPDPAKAGRAMAAMMTMVKIDVAAIEAAAEG